MNADDFSQINKRRDDRSKRGHGRILLRGGLLAAVIGLMVGCVGFSWKTTRAPRRRLPEPCRRIGAIRWRFWRRVFCVSKRVILMKPRGIMVPTGRSLHSNRRGGCYSVWKSPIKQATRMHWVVMSWHCAICTRILLSTGPGWSVRVDNEYSV